MRVLQTPALPLGHVAVKGFNLHGMTEIVPLSITKVFYFVPLNHVDRILKSNYNPDFLENPSPLPPSLSREGGILLFGLATAISPPSSPLQFNNDQNFMKILN